MAPGPSGVHRRPFRSGKAPSRPVGPVLGTVEQAQDGDHVGLDAVDEEKACAGHDQFARPVPPPGSSDGGILGVLDTVRKTLAAPKIGRD